MTPLHVLVYAPLTAGACNVYRFGILARSLAAHGVELRSLSNHKLAVPSRDAASPDRMYASEDLVLDRTDLDWADVIVFRRFYSTTWTCIDCAFVSRDSKLAREHATTTLHEVGEPDRLVRPLYNALESFPELLRGRAIVYETDDDVLNFQAWNGMRSRVAPERDFVQRVLGRADLVTVTTPVLRERLVQYNDEIRVLRNAIDPTWYAVPPDAPPVVGSPRLLYYGSPVRFRDYEICQPAVDEVVRTVPGARRVWLGALNARAGGAPTRVLGAVDEVGPFIDDPETFAASLAAARPDIGLAPLVGDSFDQAKSELHWLEYTMAGAATIGTRIPGGGPYDPIRHGVDGLLVTTPDEWSRELRRLAGSASLREDLVGRARERIMAEYTVDVRAAEWAAAYRWAAEHAGRRVEGRVHGLGALSDEVMTREGRASLSARAAGRAASEAAAGLLEAARGGRPSCGSAVSAGNQALVSVVIPVTDEPPEAVARALASVLTGSHQRLDVVLAVDASWPYDTADVLTAGAPGDGRVRVVCRDVDPGLPPGAPAERMARVGRLLGDGVAESAGEWIAPLSPDAAFSADHVEVLLRIAQEHELEFVYGQARVVVPAGEVTLGAWPPTADEVLTTATELFAAPLARVAPFRPDAWRDGETTAWAFWRSMLQLGVRMAGIEYEVASLAPLGLSDAIRDLHVLLAQGPSDVAATAATSAAAAPMAAGVTAPAASAREGREHKGAARNGRRRR